MLLSALFLDEGSWPMLDEPTDHLDEEGRELLAQYLSHSRRGFLLVSHDRAFLDRCVDHVLALNRTGPELVKGNFSVWYQEKQDRGPAGAGPEPAAEGGDPPTGAGGPPDLCLVRPGGKDQIRQ